MISRLGSGLALALALALAATTDGWASNITFNWQLDKGSGPVAYTTSGWGIYDLTNSAWVGSPASNRLSSNAVVNLAAGNYRIRYYETWQACDFSVDAGGNIASVTGTPNSSWISGVGSSTMNLTFDASTKIQWRMAPTDDLPWTFNGGYTGNQATRTVIPNSWRVDGNWRSTDWEYGYVKAGAPYNVSAGIFVYNGVNFRLNNDGTVAYTDATRPNSGSASGDTLTIYPYHTTVKITDAAGNIIAAALPASWRVAAEFGQTAAGAKVNDYPLLPGPTAYTVWFWPDNGNSLAGGAARLNVNYTWTVGSTTYGYGVPTPPLPIGTWNGTDYYVVWSVIPEPATLALLALGSLALLRRRK